MEQDWADLKKYQTENEKIIKTHNDPRAVFIGNSIVEGWARAQPEFFNNNNFIGRGIGGQTTPQMLLRFIPDVVKLNPKAVVILAGTNDIAENSIYFSAEIITNNIQAMAQIALANNIEVILASILPVSKYPWSPNFKPGEKIVEINSFIKNFTDTNDLTYLNLFSALKNEKNGLPKQYSDDGVHPNLAGYRVMAAITQKVIDNLL